MGGRIAPVAGAAGAGKQFPAQLLLPRGFAQHAGFLEQAHIGQHIAVARLSQLLLGFGRRLLRLQLFQQAAHTNLPPQPGGLQFGAVAFQQALLGADAVLVAVGIEIGLAHRLPYLPFGGGEQFPLLQFAGGGFADAAAGLAAVVQR